MLRGERKRGREKQTQKSTGCARRDLTRLKISKQKKQNKQQQDPEGGREERGGFYKIFFRLYINKFNIYSQKVIAFQIF